MNPFVLPAPGYVSFSGGRTSGKMLWEFVRAGLGPGVYVVFLNTGKERSETLDFVEDCSQHWGCPITWLERPPGGGFVEVTHATASRNGEPFEALIREKGWLPNPGAPYCSSELKFRVARDWMWARHGRLRDFHVAVGLRADERRRVAKLRGRKAEGGIVECPLYDAGINVHDVMNFWAAQPFDLQLHQHEGNCDLCWKKSGAKVSGLIDQVPDRAEWWARQERETGTRWRNDRMSYTTMLDGARRQVRLTLFDDGGEPCEMCA
jgi:3'-phosphoadenosine 5'-phosphosulfate sulfotransferase (PAPS reductase)/FAD synthetase